MCSCPQITNKLINNLLSDISVGEIILINNAKRDIKVQNNIVRVITPDTNLYVNPSWNLGIKESKYEYFALLNDDLLLCNNFFSKLLFHINDSTGIIGADVKHIHTSYKPQDYEELPEEHNIILKAVNERTYAFGILMAGKKSSYYPIPDQLKVWCGDDYLVKANIDAGKQNYVIQGPIIKHIESLTSNNPIFEAIKQNDLNIYKTMDKNFWYK